MNKVQQLPYFDFLFEQFDGQPALEHLFRDHVHWGLFDSGHTGPVSEEIFARAARALSQKLIALADLEPGMNILDVGCGFGGTARLIAENTRHVRVTGLNVDPRQVQKAQQITADERVCFVEADACSMPFPSNSFDRLIAVESVFHFPSRMKFLREVRRVLKPGGQLVLSDFVLNGFKLPSTAAKILLQGNPMERFYGRVNATTITGYFVMAAVSGLRLLEHDNVTAKTLPTYASLQQVAQHINEVNAPLIWQISLWSGWLSRTN
jgi:ubiquinone/menaquinone biosynthesis C-methylase UbiE